MKKQSSVAQVRVSLKEGLTILDLKPGNATTLADLRRIIKNNGFVSKEATIVATGAPSPDRKTFVVSGTNERLTITTPPEQSGDAWRMIVAPPQR